MGSERDEMASNRVVAEDKYIVIYLRWYFVRHKRPTNGFQSNNVDLLHLHYNIVLRVRLSSVPGNVDEPSDGHAAVHRRGLQGGSGGGEETLLFPGGQTLHVLLPVCFLPREGTSHFCRKWSFSLYKHLTAISMFYLMCF